MSQSAVLLAEPSQTCLDKRNKSSTGCVHCLRHALYFKMLTSNGHTPKHSLVPVCCC